ncbi:MAG: hypothetical protein EOP06_21350 [Proteobacteria bacterium]|nr:MAG: hypothetical protein EOP06_21350 [Pseudomonadota bacterium]
MKVLLGALLAFAAISVSSGEPASAAGPVERCGPGEAYPCPGRGNPREPGKGPNLPPERCGPGEAYPCPGRGTPREPGNPGRGPALPPERCGPGEAYPCL